jgi:hypothetical protein
MRAFFMAHHNMKKRKKAHIVIRTHYTIMDELMASPTEPMPLQKRTHHLTIMWQGLAALETAPEATPNDWRLCSDAVNLMETLITQTGWLDCSGQEVTFVDSHGLLNQASDALAKVGMRYREGHPLHLEDEGAQAVRGILESYSDAVEALPHRTMIRCHRKTEITIQTLIQTKSHELIQV